MERIRCAAMADARRICSSDLTDLVCSRGVRRESGDGSGKPGDDLRRECRITMPRGLQCSAENSPSLSAIRQLLGKPSCFQRVAHPAVVHLKPGSRGQESGPFVLSR